MGVLAVSVSGWSWAGFVRYSGGEIITDGHIELTEAPGLGLEVNEEVALEHSEGGIPFFGS